MIRLFVMDVDGTLTDGGLYLDGQGTEWKRFDVRDGLGLAKLRAAGVTLCIISGRYSAVTQRRAEELGVDLVHQGVGDKLAILQRVAEEAGVPRPDVAYIGDDDNDAECLRWAGAGFAPSDAQPAARQAADVVTDAPGGRGAVREAIERILQELWAEEGSWDGRV
jgi:3-deoxy-D-manno-octulosonate 8-phosphate phosphatase (KDO 8-P phosphatase)